MRCTCWPWPRAAPRAPGPATLELPCLVWVCPSAALPVTAPPDSSPHGHRSLPPVPSDPALLSSSAPALLGPCFLERFFRWLSAICTGRCGSNSAAPGRPFLPQQSPGAPMACLWVSVISSPKCALQTKRGFCPFINFITLTLMKSHHVLGPGVLWWGSLQLSLSVCGGELQGPRGVPAVACRTGPCVLHGLPCGHIHIPDGVPLGSSVQQGLTAIISHSTERSQHQAVLEVTDAAAPAFLGRCGRVQRVQCRRVRCRSPGRGAALLPTDLRTWRQQEHQLQGALARAARRRGGRVGVLRS